MTARPEPVALVASIPWHAESGAEPGVSYRPGDLLPLAHPRSVTLTGGDGHGGTALLGRVVRGTPSSDGYRLEVVVDPARPAGADLLATIAQPGYAPYVLPRIVRGRLVGASICNVET
jgi:hypothetical protein